jgi:SAM-dependent methyltransferase
MDGVADDSVDAVVAVDSAYHFDTRSDFLSDARRVLRPGGRVAWTDLVLTATPGSPRRRRRWRRVASALDVPPDNLCGPDEYVDGIRTAGLEPVEHRWLTREVLDGFARFSIRHARRHLWQHPDRGWAKIVLSGLGARYCVASGHLGYGLFVARKPLHHASTPDDPHGSGAGPTFGKP